MGSTGSSRMLLEEAFLQLSAVSFTFANKASYLQAKKQSLAPPKTGQYGQQRLEGH